MRINIPVSNSMHIDVMAQRWGRRQEAGGATAAV